MKPVAGLRAIKAPALAQAFGRDLRAALLEDVVAIVGAALIVAAAR